MKNFYIFTLLTEFSKSFQKTITYLFLKPTLIDSFSRNIRNFYRFKAVENGYGNVIGAKSSHFLLSFFQFRGLLWLNHYILHAHSIELFWSQVY